MSSNYKLLILGCANSIYIVNFIKFLKRENPLAKIFFFGPETNSTVADSVFFDCLEEYYFFKDSIRSKRIPYIRRIERAILWRKHFCRFTKTKHFDIINIHFVEENYLFLLDLMKKASSKIVLSPWGSDVYRIGYCSKYTLKLLYKCADYVSGVDNRFTKDVERIFNIPKNKIVYFDLGSETIDYIIENKNRLTTEQAKKHWGMDGAYTITCGYNASPAQQHLKILYSIAKIRNQLPKCLLLIFPFTYGGSLDYMRKVKCTCEELGLNAVFFEDFLDLPNLLRLRMATDLFVHVQTTDANSTSFGEYLLCEKKLINGSWLKYDELIINNIEPYFVVNDIEKLDETILLAYQSDKPIISMSLIKILAEKGCGINAQRANSVFEKISKK